MTITAFKVLFELDVSNDNQVNNQAYTFEYPLRTIPDINTVEHRTRVNITEHYNWARYLILSFAARRTRPIERRKIHGYNSGSDWKGIRVYRKTIAYTGYKAGSNC